jgi:hypothetical protein
MTFSNKVIANFAGGEVSPLLFARTDLPLFAKVLSRMQNFIAEPQGPARFRPGTVYVHHTRNNNPARFIEFQYSDVQSYLIEATEGYFRFYKDGAIILNSTALTITGISKALPGVVTYTGTDPTNGQEVYIEDVAGMTEVNGKFFTVANVNTGANTFELTDVHGNNVNTTNYTTYTSGGTVSVVYEIQTPYLEEHLDELQYAQNADTMYIASEKYEPRQLTRSAHDSWTLARYSRTADPFAANNVTYGEITGITAANPGVVSDAAHTFLADDHVYVSGIVGMTELNNRHFLIGSPAAGTYQLKDYDTGVAVDTSAYTAWSSGGIVELIAPTRATTMKYPAAVSFTDDGRVVFGGSGDKPETQWYSKSPSAAGAVQFTDFTTGSGATDAIIFTFAPLRGRVDSIRWITNTDKYIAFGTFGSVRRVYGATEAASISPDEVTAKPANSDGVEHASPVSDGATLFYIQRGGLALESIEYDYSIDGYAPDDKNLVSNHLTAGGFKQMVRQIGRPTVIWVVRNDGILLGLTYKAKENIAGWHRHYLGGAGQVEAAGIMPRENNQDQLWLIVKRTIGGNTVRYVEYMSDPPEFPDLVDYWSGASTSEAKTLDTNRFENYQSEVAKDAIHLDSSLTYDGSAYGTDASATLTVGNFADVEDTENVVFTASAAVFTSDMVGREIWGGYLEDGSGGGRAEITEFTSSTSVKCTILDGFWGENVVYSAGDWYITATTVSGLDHLEGELVGIIADGAAPDAVAVDGGSITLSQPASKIHVGLKYTGILRTLPLDQGGVTGPAQSKYKIVSELGLRFVNSAGVQYGTDLYHLSRLHMSRGNDVTDRPIPLFTGVERITYPDTWGIDKELFVVQDDPLPCTLAAMDVYMDTVDE